MTTAEEFNSWLTAVALALSEHLKKLGNSGPEQNLRAAIEKFLEALPGLQATKDNLDEKKDLADVLLRPIEVIKAAARLLVTGAALLGAALETILDALAGKVDEVPFNLINKLLDFLIAQQEALGNEEMAKKLRAIKQIKESVEEAAEKVNRLKKAIKELQEELKKK